MSQRRLLAPFAISGIEQHDDNHTLVEPSCIPMGRAVAPENGPFIGPMDHMLRGSVHSDSQWISEGRANEHSSSSVNMEVQHFAPAFSGPTYDPYPHSSISVNLPRGPVNNVGHVHSSHYNGPSIHDVEGGLLNSTTGMRGPFKRKSPGISGTCDIGSSSSFYSAGSSSSSSQMLMERPTADSHNVPPYRGTTLSIAGEDWARNVRSRYRVELGPSMTRTHSSSYSSHVYHSTAHPANYSGPVHPPNLHADGTSREWNCVPLYAATTHGRITTPDINGSSHERSQFLVGGSAAVVDASHHEPIFSRHHVSSSQYLHGPHAQVAREGHNNYSRRTTPPYRNGLSYSHSSHGATSSTNGLHSPSESFSSRYSRHSSAGGWRSNYRNGRSRIAVERFQPIVDVVDAHDRMGPETLVMVDRESFYGSSRNLLDQYRDMRLDTDSMTYEELLALEERIGTVSTGLSEDSMFTCLMEKVYRTLDQNHEEVNCPICLEEYKNGERIGSMKKCGHEYHVECIKKWLLMNKVCPICKSECST